MSGITNLRWTGERIIPENGRYMFRRHLMAYRFILRFCPGNPETATP